MSVEPTPVSRFQRFLFADVQRSDTGVNSGAMPTVATTLSGGPADRLSPAQSAERVRLSAARIEQRKADRVKSPTVDELERYAKAVGREIHLSVQRADELKKGGNSSHLVRTGGGSHGSRRLFVCTDRRVVCVGAFRFFPTEVMTWRRPKNRTTAERPPLWA